MEKDYKASVITLRDFYKHYKYPCWDITKNTVPIPYIPKEKLKCEHSRALTFKQYRTILRIYNKYFVMYLLSGLNIKMPFYMGEFRLFRFKPQKLTSFDINIYLKTNQKIYYKNRNTGGYFPLFRWQRAGRRSRLATRWVWKCIPTRTVWKQISNEFKRDGSSINKLSVK